MPRYPGPYVESGPDGNRYYITFGVSRYTIALYEDLVVAADLAARFSPTAAVEIATLIREIQTRMDQVAAKTATVAVEEILTRIDQTRKRPTSATGASQSGRLASGVTARPLPMVLPRGSGGVGIGAIDELEAATVSGHPTNSPYPYYWRTQEDGSSAMVGHSVFGVFQPGEARPTQAQFRLHPTFEQRDIGDTPRYKMIVRRSVSARHFLKSGAGAAYLYRAKQIKVVEGEAIARMDAISRRFAVTPAGRRRP